MQIILLRDTMLPRMLLLAGCNINRGVQYLCVLSGAADRLWIDSVDRTLAQLAAASQSLRQLGWWSCPYVGSCDVSTAVTMVGVAS